MELPLWPSNVSFDYLPEKSKTFIHKICAPHVHSMFTHGGQDMETTEVSFDRGLDKEGVVHADSLFYIDKVSF